MSDQHSSMIFCKSRVNLGDQAICKYNITEWKVVKVTADIYPALKCSGWPHLYNPHNHSALQSDHSALGEDHRAGDCRAET